MDQTKQTQEQASQEDQEPPIFDVEDLNGVEELPTEVQDLWHNWLQCDGCKRWWSSPQLLNYHKRKNGNTNCAVPNLE